jgi:hypothetical protein
VVLLKAPDSIIENQGKQSKNPENHLNLGIKYKVQQVLKTHWTLLFIIGYSHQKSWQAICCRLTGAS